MTPESLAALLEATANLLDHIGLDGVIPPSPCECLDCTLKPRLRAAVAILRENAEPVEHVCAKCGSHGIRDFDCSGDGMISHPHTGMIPLYSLGKG